jgi:hypothetical protein
VGGIGLKFFTDPPRPYPYILINVRNPHFRFLKYAEEVIIDSGVEMFRDPNVKDYPRGHVSRVLKTYLRVREIVHPKPIHVTCMDYCDDYNPGALWLSPQHTNIERTVENLLKYSKRYDWVPWLPVIQGWCGKPESVRRCIDLYRKHGVLEEFSYFAVGNLCVEDRGDVIYRTVKIVREELPDVKIHVFGLKLNALRRVSGLIDSFDSLAWSMAVDSSVKKDPSGRYMCRNMEERRRYFERWLEKVRRITGQKTLELR